MLMRIDLNNKENLNPMNPYCFNMVHSAAEIYDFSTF